MRNDIYSIVTEYVKELIEDVHCGSTYEIVPKAFPYLYLHELSEYDASPDIYNEDEIAHITFEAQVFSKSSPMPICQSVRAAFKSLGFTEKLLQFPDNADPAIRRAVMRFETVRI